VNCEELCKKQYTKQNKHNPFVINNYGKYQTGSVKKVCPKAMLEKAKSVLKPNNQKNHKDCSLLEGDIV
jgi:hypothetical protein